MSRISRNISIYLISARIYTSEWGNPHRRTCADEVTPRVAKPLPSVANKNIDREPSPSRACSPRKFPVEDQAAVVDIRQRDMTPFGIAQHRTLCSPHGQHEQLKFDRNRNRMDREKIRVAEMVTSAPEQTK